MRCYCAAGRRQARRGVAVMASKVVKPQRLLSIGEAAAHSGVPAKTIRFYEEAGIIKPAQRGENGYRVYGEADVQTLHFIHRPRARGFRPKDVAELLELYRNRKRAS